MTIGMFSDSSIVIRSLLITGFIVLLCDPSRAHGGHQQQGKAQEDPKHKKPHKFGDIDKKHIQHHLNDMGLKDADLNDQKLEFYHFKIHDVNNDSRIDGLEMFRVLKEEEEEMMSEDDQYKIEDGEVASQVDHYLDEVDKNKDGYIDYLEYKANSHFFIY